ncbi:hypothetical protein NPIL_394301 [Nephila pilipes]|uniref:Uncharacterized protein n=1 Tax=Nephila pilipes TaxID=299642 RepID=A0A8X6ML13_NEPPI|nr:hypothetical protein NPIL_394301 [Nephila pilipes]
MRPEGLLLMFLSKNHLHLICSRNLHKKAQMARTKQTPSGVKLVRAGDAIVDGEEENAEAVTEPVELADMSDSAQVECHSQPLPLDHCRKLQLDVEEYAHTLKGISEVEGQMRHAQLFPFLCGAQDMEKLQLELQRWKNEKENIEGKLSLLYLCP